MGNYRITVQVSLRQDILDPAGRATEKSLKSMGFDAQDTRIGKTISLSLAAENVEAAKAEAAKMADQLLANPVMEDYEISAIENL